MAASMALTNGLALRRLLRARPRAGRGRSAVVVLRPRRPRY